MTLPEFVQTFGAGSSVVEYKLLLLIFLLMI